MRLMVGYRNPRGSAMIMLSSLTEHVVLIGVLTLMLGLARVAYGGQLT